MGLDVRNIMRYQRVIGALWIYSFLNWRDRISGRDVQDVMSWFNEPVGAFI